MQQLLWLSAAVWVGRGSSPSLAFVVFGCWMVRRLETASVAAIGATQAVPKEGGVEGVGTRKNMTVADRPAATVRQRVPPGGTRERGNDDGHPRDTEPGSSRRRGAARGVLWRGLLSREG